MQRIIYLLAAVLLTAGSVSAQRMPERAAVRRGNRQFNKGNYEQSIERYMQALTYAPESFEATYDLGNALYEAERFDLAEQALLQAAADTLRTEPERAEAFYNLGNAQFRQQKYREALESYKQSLRLNPSDREAKYNYAYTKKLLENDENNNGGGGGGGNDQQQNQDQNQNQNENHPQNGEGQNSQQDRNDPQQNPQQNQEQPQNGGGEQQQPSRTGISEQEQQQMLDAIQAQEDRTQEKLKEKQGVVVRGKKHW